MKIMVTEKKMFFRHSGRTRREVRGVNIDGAGSAVALAPMGWGGP